MGLGASTNATMPPSIRHHAAIMPPSCHHHATIMPPSCRHHGNKSAGRSMLLKIRPCIPEILRAKVCGLPVITSKTGT